MSQTVRLALTAAALSALAACSPSSSSSSAPVESSAPSLSGAPSATYTPPGQGVKVAPTAPSSQSVNPPTAGAPPANAGDVQAEQGVGPSGPVNSPRRLHESRDGERG